MSYDNLLPRKKFSYNNLKLYKSLGSLIKEYRQWRNISQESLAELIKVSVRELQNWEANRRSIRIENLHDISELTGIPMQVLVALNVDQPIWYSLRKRLFMYSLLEMTQFYSKDLFLFNENLTNPTLMKAVPITTEKQINMILSCHQDLYGVKKSLQPDIIKAAATIVPDLNIVVHDYWGHYVAHRVCLPITMDVYQAIIKQDILEENMTSKMISDIVKLGEGVFFVYSTFIANISALSWSAFRGIRTLSKIKNQKNYKFANYTVTNESTIIQKNLDMTFVKNYPSLCDEICPTIYESKLNYQLRPDGPFRWMIKSAGEEELTKNLSGEAQQKKSLVIPCTKPSDLVSSLKKYSPMDMVQSDVLTVDKNAVLTVDTLSSNSEKQNYQKRLKSQIPSELKITIEVCPNIKCALYAKSDKANIISNGTFRLKDGTTLRRYICKECGKSFCSRTSSVFYGIRSQDEKVMEALKLLVKGMSLRGVAKIIGVEFRTVRSWLKVAAEQNEKINEMFIKKLKVTQIELDVLWAFVKSNSLRQRSFLCRTKNKSHITD